MPRKRTTNIKGRGGKRPGAGRKKGTVAAVKAEAREKAALEGILPAEYMLKVMRDGRVPKKRRDMMAIACAPYYHSKLSSVELKNKKGEALRMVSETMSAKEAAEAFATTMSQPSFEDADETKH